MKIKHYDHIKSINKKREALHRTLGANVPGSASIPFELSKEIENLYSDNTDPKPDNSVYEIKEEEAASPKKKDVAEEKKEQKYDSDIELLEQELLSDKKKSNTSPSAENPNDTIERIMKEKEEIQRRLEVSVSHKMNERVQELEHKFENVLNKLSSDSLILLNSLDMGAFKKEISYFMVEFAHKDEGFRTEVHNLFDEIGQQDNPKTKKEIDKTLERKKNEKVQSKAKDILMVVAAAVVFIGGALYYVTGGSIASKKKDTAVALTQEEEREKFDVANVKENKSIKKVAKSENVSTDIVVADAPEEVNFLVETKRSFKIRCTNGFRKRFVKKKRLRGHIENGRFYFKTKQDGKHIYCSISESAIEEMY